MVLQMERLFEAAVRLADEGRTMFGGIPRPLDLALFLREFEEEVEAAFVPRWLQRCTLAPVAWLARRREASTGRHRVRSLPVGSSLPVRVSSRRPPTRPPQPPGSSRQAGAQADLLWLL